jgi:hypothetical protein
MKTNACVIILLSAFLFPIFAQAESPILLNLPKSGAPISRLGGGTRGSDKSTVNIQILAPERLGLTTQAAPTLYWYISMTSTYPIEFTLGIENDSEPLIEKKLPPVTSAGIQSIKLSELGVQLKPGQEYRWSIALVADAAQRSNDIFVSATIRKDNTNISLNDVEKLSSAGFWYDVLQRLIEKKSPQVDDLLKSEGIVLESQ